MKKLIQFIAIIIIFLFAKNASAYDFECDGLYYTVTSIPDMTCEVAKGDYMYEGDIKIPTTATYKNREFKVIGIGARAFYNCENLTSILLHDNINYINNGAFYYCKSLSSIDIPNSVTYIGSGVFYGCEVLKSADIPNSITEINDDLFRECKSLTTVSLSNAITQIKSNSFSGCMLLTHINLPEYLVKIGENAFKDCNITSIVIPDSVTNIGTKAFSNCKNLKTIVLPKSLKTIEAGIFENCTNLTSISIPGSVEVISDSLSRYNRLSPFAGCDNLREFTFEPSLSTCSINGDDQRIIPDSVKSLNLYRNIKFHKNFESKYNPEFANLTDLCIGDNITLQCLSRAVVLIEGNLPILYISVYPIPQFSMATLERITIGENIKPFFMPIYPNTKAITLTTPNPPDLSGYEESWISNSEYMNIIVTVPKGSLERYQNAYIWKNFWELREADTSGIDDITADSGEKTEIGRYDLFGRKVSDSQKGFVIIKYSDGSTKKTLIK